MTSLYEVLKRSKTAPQLAPDMFTALWAKSITAEKTIELSGQVPLSFKANGKPLLDYLISGNTVQNGTPTPSAPITPSETGDKTANLSPESTLTNSSTVDTRIYFQIRILYYNDNTYLGASEIFNSRTTGYKVVSFNIDSENCNKLRIVHNGETRNIVFEEIAGVFSGDYTISFNCINNDPTTINGISLSNVMLNTGSTALPFEPHGQYKIPISSANTTTPVYLGEAESTRRIKKLVLTGGEDWLQSVLEVRVYRINVPDYLREIDNIPICTHYKGIAPVAGTGGLQDLETAFLLSASGNNYYYIRDDRFNNTNDFKTYLQQQYANGTPVTVWYVLAEPSTGILNEPIRKIGDYADTLSMEQAGVQIPTNNGSTTLDVLTAVKPSNVSIKYRV